MVIREQEQQGEDRSKEFSEGHQEESGRIPSGISLAKYCNYWLEQIEMCFKMKSVTHKNN